MKSKIEETTCLVPRIIAENAIWEYMETPRYFPSEATPIECHEFTELVKPILLRRIEWLYTENKNIRHNIKATGEKGRDYLYSFFQHWTHAIFNRSVQTVWFEKEKQSFEPIYNYVDRLREKYNYI